MTALSPHSIFNCAIGADQTGPSVGTGETLLYFLGGNLTPAAAAAALTVYDGAAAGNIVLLTLAAPASGGTAPGNLPTEYAVRSTSIHYTLSGTSATAQLYWQSG